MARIALAVIVTVAFPLQARAAGCGQFFYRQQVVVAYSSPAYYQVGRDLEAEALAEKVARLSVPKIVAQLRAMNLREHQLATTTRATSSLNEHCGKCHSGATPKAGLTLDGLTAIPDGHFRRIVEIIGAGLDVPLEMQKLVANLPPETKGKLLDELVSLKPQVAERLPPPPAGDIE